MWGFSERLAAAVRRCGNPVCVGLDPRPYQPLPPGCAHGPADDPEALAAACGEFCQRVIDVVAPLVPAVKPQAAFFEQLGWQGMRALAEVIAYARGKGLLVIVDGKRNDIGTTAEAYADAYLGAALHRGGFGADAVTVSPYLGDDSLQPFVAAAYAREAGVFVLVKTSNPGGKTFQDLVCDGRPLYRHVGDLVERLASKIRANSPAECGYGPVGAVVGATYPEQLVELRAAMPHAWILVPGFGAQGGTAKDAAGAFDSQGLGAIVNNSRGIIYAHTREQFAHFGPHRWQSAVEAATREMIDQLRAETNVGRLPVP